jgi:hypothetical protein
MTNYECDSDHAVSEATQEEILMWALNGEECYWETLDFDAAAKMAQEGLLTYHQVGGTTRFKLDATEKTRPELNRLVGRREQEARKDNYEALF